ncbi:MAG: 1-acyl-sn-glycerol-3-phosphate acyltransferase [Myxococcales bacterium]|nr:1-acyl-sn-glycerol-3-phosphate acyltransferase [Myxococcales bacterium]
MWYDVAVADASTTWTPREREAVGRFDPSRTVTREILAPIVTLACRGLIQGVNRLVLHDGHVLKNARKDAKERSRGILTVSNHVSLFDDPWLMACLAKPRWKDLRWIPVDALNFFSTDAKAWFFGAGKGVPIIRGGGIDQPAMRFLAERLQAGEWVHVFPEGTRSRSPLELHRPLKSGTAHLIQAARPLVLPFHHRGMEKVLPIGSRWPKTGQRVEVRFGDVVDSARGLADRPLDQITQWVEDRLVELQQRAERA